MLLKVWTDNIFFCKWKTNVKKKNCEEWKEELSMYKIQCNDHWNVNMHTPMQYWSDLMYNKV